MTLGSRIARKFASLKIGREPFNNDDVATKKYVDYRTFIGDVKYSIKTQDHNGWLVCDGRSLSRTQYADLFAVIGTSFGADNGSTFKLPNCAGRVIGAAGSGVGLSARTIGQTTGAETHTLTINEMPAHTHTINDPGHSHVYVNNINDQNTDNAFASETAADNADLTQTTSVATTGITLNSTGGGQAHNNMQPTIFIGLVFIFAEYVKAPARPWSVELYDVET